MGPLLMRQSEFVDGLQNHLQNGFLVFQNLHGKPLQHQRNVKQQHLKNISVPC